MAVLKSEAHMQKHCTIVGPHFYFQHFNYSKVQNSFTKERSSRGANACAQAHIAVTMLEHMTVRKSISYCTYIIRIDIFIMSLP